MLCEWDGMGMVFVINLVVGHASFLRQYNLFLTSVLLGIFIVGHSLFFGTMPLFVLAGWTCGHLFMLIDGLNDSGFTMMKLPNPS